MIVFDLPKDVTKVLETIHKSGEEAYVVGGCVRDLMLGVLPNDWDITTSADPEKIKQLFKKTIDTGLSHGTVTVMLNHVGYEVTTYRVDGKYEDFRRPKDVVFTRSLEEDLLRRDFTINAMAYNNTHGLIDLYGGQKDLKNRSIRCVGNAPDRFNEDALRMLRAIRFGAKLGFDIHTETYEAICEFAHLITHVSAERIQVELNKTLLSHEPRRIKSLVDTGLIKYIIPEFMSIVGLSQENDYHVYPVDEHTYQSLGFIEPILHLRWTMYLHDIGKGQSKTMDDQGMAHFYGHPKKSHDIAKKVLFNLHFDNKNTDKILRLIMNHDDPIETTKNSVRRAINRIGVEHFKDFMAVKSADIKAQNPIYRDKRLKNVEEILTIYDEIIEQGECFAIKDLTLNGKDLLQAGIENGKQIGEALNLLLEYVLENPEMNTKDALLAYLKEMGKLEP